MMLRDVLAILGLVLVGYGCWQVSPPLAEIVVGAILLAVVLCSVWLNRRKGSSVK